MLNKKTDRRMRMRRILSWILAILMLGSVCGSLIYNVLVTRVYASDPEARLALSTGVDSAGVDSTPVDMDSIKIRVGLMYGASVTVGFETTSPYGFGINKVNRLATDLSHELLWKTEIKKTACVIDANLSKSAMTYSKAKSGEKIIIGGWHVELGAGLTRAETESLIASLTPTLTNIGVYAIPSFIDSGWRVRIGHFATEELAEDLSVKLKAALPELTMKVVGPTDTAVSLIDPETDIILFEYDCGDDTALGLTALPSPSGETAYLVTPAKKLYDGVFMFRRYNSSTSSGAGSVDGVSLTDIIELGEYIKGVLPYEISNSWPLESQKAFAICVRSFTLSGLNRHESAYELDMCNTTHCQVYNGRARINDTVERAVEETAGQVMTYNDKIVSAYYSAVSGGVTVSSEDAWGGVLPYLVAVQTPWEIYTNHAYGQWTSEVSATELCQYLRDVKGYSQLKGKIASIKIDQLAKNSTYITKLTITDSYGTSITVNKSDAIRTLLSKYVYSANFVVGKGSVYADRTTFASEAAISTAVRTNLGTSSLSNGSLQSVLTSSGIASTPKLTDAGIQSASGLSVLGNIISSTEQVTILASNADNFIFAGKGQGHGVGLSQIGLRDLAAQNVPADEMLRMYFNGVEIRDYRISK